MHVPFGFLMLGIALGAESSAVAIKDSPSPDGKYCFVATSGNDGIYYQVQTKAGRPVSEQMRSDFGTLRRLDEAQRDTSVHWRSDDKFVIAFTGHDRHHVDFLILTKTTTGFQLVPFDWEKLDEFAHLEPLGFGYPAFLLWRANGNAVIDLFEFDGRNTIRESTFDVNLTDRVDPVSWKAIKPEQKLL